MLNLPLLESFRIKSILHVVTISAEEQKVNSILDGKIKLISESRVKFISEAKVHSKIAKNKQAER